MNATSKLVKAWESKNAKNAAKAGGLSLMALSLAACGGSDSTTTAVVADPVTPVTPVTPTGSSMTMTSGTDTVTASSGSLNGSAASVRFANGSNETVNGQTSTIQATDNMLDGDGTDSDVMNITVTGAMNAMTATNIETVNVTVGAGSSQSAVFTNFSGLDAVNVSGTAAVTVDDAGAASVNLVDFTRVVTINNGTFAGSADVVNVSVSGATYGSTAATQSGVTLTTEVASGILETLNITSSGSAANAFNLDASTNTTLKTVNVLGATDVTAHVAYGDVTGKTLTATDHTGVASLNVDLTGITTGAVNALNIRGFDNIIATDSASPSKTGDDANFSNLAAGQKVTYADDFQGSDLTVHASTYSAMATSLTVALDNATANEHTQIDVMDIQNVAALNIISNGNVSTSTSTDEVNQIDELKGDASTITVTGDTSLDLNLNMDAEQTASGTAARVVTVDASGMTGTAYLDAVASAPSTAKKVSYVLKGSDNKDILDVESNDRDSTIYGNGGDDTIKLGDGDDTVDGGAGADTIEINLGTNTITGGAGNDVFDFDTAEVAGTSQVLTYDESAVGALETSDILTITINGTHSYQVTFATSHDASMASFVSTHAADILTNHGVTVTATTVGSDNTAADDDLTFTGPTDGTDVTVSATVYDASGTTTIARAISTSGGTDAKVVANTITDFSVGDVINTAGIATITEDYFEGKVGDLASTNANATVVVLTGASYLNAAAAEDAYTSPATATDHGIVVFLNSTLGYAQVIRDNDMDGDDGVGANQIIADLTNITSLTELADTLSSDSFVTA